MQIGKKMLLPFGASNQSLMKGWDVDVKHPTPDISSDCVIAEWTDRLKPEALWLTYVVVGDVHSYDCMCMYSRI